jgi:hypothetical protein
MLALLLPYAVLGLIGGWIAAQKGYPPVWGIIVGALLGPVALVIAACLPATADAKRRAVEEQKTKQELSFTKQSAPCPKCRRENSIATRICPKCGFRFQSASVEAKSEGVPHANV